MVVVALLYRDLMFLTIEFYIFLFIFLKTLDVRKATKH